MYYILILVILSIYIYNEKHSYNTKRELYFCASICLLLVIMAAFRSNAVGADTGSYRFDYESMPLYGSLESLIDRYSINYIGYFGLCKLFSMAGLPVQVWFGFLEGFYLYALMILVNRFSKDKIFSLLIFTTIGLFSFSLAGLKQTFAASLMMIAFVKFMDKKYLFSASLIVLTYFTHQAALIMLGAFPIYWLRNNKFLIPVIAVICLLIYFYSYSFMEAMVTVMGNEKWEDYLVRDSSYSYVTLIFYFTIVGISLANIKGYLKYSSGEARLCLGLSALGCALQVLAGVSPNLFRLAFLYTPFFMILIPNTLYYSNSPLKKLYKLFISLAVIFYFLYTGRNSPYSFI